ncbi:MAG: class I SAM-dependent methyltransferase [Eubacteriales bacterium]|nr:class I SAM-dependent methyltransferase [Eubacteriales bacterium]
MKGLYAKMFARPDLWQRSPEPFWDDAHISKGMLEAHLNPTLDAASRSKDTIRRSVDWIASILPQTSKILDLGCGPGLYCRQFSDLGFDVTGVDFSQRSIGYAKEHDPRTRYIYQNYLEIDYTDAFDVIIMIYCDYAALTAAERQTLLSKVRSALRPNGIFLFDVFTDVHSKGISEKNVWSVHENGGFWSADPHIAFEAAYLYENGTVSLSRNLIVTESGMKEYFIWDTSYNLQRLTEEVSAAGFEVKAAYDDVCGRAYTGNSETLCVILADRRS